jgi:RNA polymerase sigma-70 factor (ECF subfamily)
MISPSLSVTPVAELVRHVQKRDVLAQKSFEALYMLSQRSILKHIEYMVKDKRVAEELCQDTFLAAWTSLRQKDPNVPLDFDRWLHRIAANNAITYLRHERHYKFIPLPEEEADAYQAIPPLASQEPGTEEHICNLTSVDQLLDQLSPTARLCLILYVQWGFSQKEIAEILGGVDPRRVNDHIRRARQPLRRLYPDLIDKQKMQKKEA